MKPCGEIWEITILNSLLTYNVKYSSIWENIFWHKFMEENDNYSIFRSILKTDIWCLKSPPKPLRVSIHLNYIL